MEKIEQFLSKTLHIKDTLLYDILMELSAEVIDAFRNHLYQLGMSLCSILLLIYQFYNEKLTYLKYTRVDGGFIQYLFPTIIGAIIFNLFWKMDTAGGRSRLIIFLSSIPLPAFTLEFILRSFGQEPNSAWYFVGGLMGYPVLMLTISTFDYLRTELPNILKKIFNIVLSAFSNRIGATKDDETDLNNN